MFFGEKINPPPPNTNILLLVWYSKCNLYPPFFALFHHFWFLKPFFPSIFSYIFPQCSLHFSHRFSSLHIFLSGDICTPPPWEGSISPGWSGGDAPPFGLGKNGRHYMMQQTNAISGLFPRQISEQAEFSYPSHNSFRAESYNTHNFWFFFPGCIVKFLLFFLRFPQLLSSFVKIW